MAEAHALTGVCLSWFLVPILLKVLVVFRDKLSRSLQSYCAISINIINLRIRNVGVLHRKTYFSLWAFFFMQLCMALAKHCHSPPSPYQLLCLPSSHSKRWLVELTLALWSLNRNVNMASASTPCACACTAATVCCCSGTCPPAPPECSQLTGKT